LAPLEHETIIRESARNGSCVTLTSHRLVEERNSFFLRHKLISVPLEHMDSIRERLASYPALFAFGVILALLGYYFGGASPDGATVLMVIGGMMVLTFVLTRHRQVEFNSARVTVKLRGTRKDLDEFILEVERARVELLRNFPSRAAASEILYDSENARISRLSVVSDSFHTDV
jgi:hypothetical protein